MTPIAIEHRPPAPGGAPDPREVFERIERMQRRLAGLVQLAARTFAGPTAGASPALECGGSTPLFLSDRWPSGSSPAPNG